MRFLPHKSRSRTLAGAFFCTLVLGTQAVLAESSEVDLLLDLLYETGKLTQEEKAVFRARLDQARAARVAATGPAPVRVSTTTAGHHDDTQRGISAPGAAIGYEPTQPLRYIDTRTQARVFRVESADGANRFGVRGRVQVDSAFANWDDNLNFASSNVGDALPTRGTVLRRARLGVLGVYDHVWEWQMEMDFRDYEVRFANVYIAYIADFGRFALGHFKEPFSLESSTSSRRLTFMERATPVEAYRPDREIGLMYETLHPDFYLAAGVFGGDGVAINRDVREGYSVALRGSFSPVRSERMFSHLGASFNYRRNDVNSNSGNYEPIRLRAREGTRAIDVRLIGRDDIEGVEDFTRIALEGAWGYGPFSVQAEYLRVDLDLDRTRGDVRIPEDSISLKGWYVQASYFLTGEQRNYRTFSGDFGPLHVLRPFGLHERGIGAWEVAARYSRANSMEHSRADRGNQMDHYTFGLNWYPNTHTVFKLNYMYFDYVGRGGVSNGNHVFAGRAQFEF